MLSSSSSSSSLVTVWAPTSVLVISSFQSSNRCAHLSESHRTLRDGSFGAAQSRHFVPGYDRTVPPGQSASRRDNTDRSLARSAWENVLRKRPSCRVRYDWAHRPFVPSGHFATSFSWMLSSILQSCSYSSSIFKGVRVKRGKDEHDEATS